MTSTSHLCMCACPTHAQAYFRDVTAEDLLALLPSHPLPGSDPALRIPFLGREPASITDLRAAPEDLSRGDLHASNSRALSHGLEVCHGQGLDLGCCLPLPCNTVRSVLPARHLSLSLHAVCVETCFPTPTAPVCDDSKPPENETSTLTPCQSLVRVCVAKTMQELCLGKSPPTCSHNADSRHSHVRSEYFV